MSLVQCPCKENKERGPFCVNFDLESSSSHKIYLTVNVAGEPKTTPFGKVNITLRKCRLELVIHNGEMPLNQRALNSLMKKNIQKTRKANTGNKRTLTLSDKRNMTASIGKSGPKASIAETASDGNTTENCQSTEDLFVAEDWQFLPGGNSSNPFWSFEDKAGQGELLGALKKEFLGVLQTKNGLPCHVHARITASPRDFVFKGESGVMPSEANRNNKIVRHMLICALFNDKINPCLSSKCYEVRDVKKNR